MNQNSTRKTCYSDAKVKFDTKTVHVTNGHYK